MSKRLLYNIYHRNVISRFAQGKVPVVNFYITFIIEMLFPVLLRERPLW